MSSSYNPHSNQLAEGAVKATKQMLRDNMGAQGTLDTDKFLAALLTHRNKPDPVTSMSSSDVVFGRRIKDLMLIKPGQLSVGTRWAELLRQPRGSERVAKRNQAASMGHPPSRQ